MVARGVGVGNAPGYVPRTHSQDMTLPESRYDLLESRYVRLASRYRTEGVPHE